MPAQRGALVLATLDEDKSPFFPKKLPLMYPWALCESPHAPFGLVRVLSWMGAFSGFLYIGGRLHCSTCLPRVWMVESSTLAAAAAVAALILKL